MPSSRAFVKTVSGLAPVSISSCRPSASTKAAKPHSPMPRSASIVESTVTLIVVTTDDSAGWHPKKHRTKNTLTTRTPNSFFKETVWPTRYRQLLDDTTPETRQPRVLAPRVTKSDIRPGLYPHPPNLAQEDPGDPRRAFWTIKH